MSVNCRMGRDNVWTDEEVKTFIAIWGETRIQKELDGAVRNKSVFQSIALRMTESGFDKNWTRCRAKLKNLKTLYKKAQDSNSRSGRGRVVCRFYDELNAILGTHDSTRPPKIIDSSKDKEDDDSSDSEDEDGDETGVSDQPSFSGNHDGESSVTESDQRSTASMERSNNSGSQLDGSDSEQRGADGMERSSNNGSQLDGTDSNTSPPLKRRKTVKEKRKVTAMERVLNGVTKAFMDYQQKCEEHFMQFEERRAREERTHEE